MWKRLKAWLIGVKREAESDGPSEWELFTCFYCGHLFPIEVW